MATEYVQHRDGNIYVGPSRVTIDSVVINWQAGLTPEQIQASFPSLSLAYVYGTIAYYLEHQDEIDAWLREGEELWERVSLRSGAIWRHTCTSESAVSWTTDDYSVRDMRPDGHGDCRMHFGNSCIALMPQLGKVGTCNSPRNVPYSLRYGMQSGMQVLWMGLARAEAALSEAQVQRRRSGIRETFRAVLPSKQ